MPARLRQDRNIAIVIGRLRRPPEVRSRPDGTEIVELEVATVAQDGSTTTVPVTCPTPLPVWEAGQPVVIVGAVRRRFYRAGGATVSRTDVLATSVLPATQAKRVGDALAAAVIAVGAP